MDERVKQLAETLKKSGLAASMYEAIEKAKSILNIDLTKSFDLKEENPEDPDYDIEKESAPLNELKKEVDVAPEQVETQKQEKIDDIKTEINDIKKDIAQAEKNPEKMEQVREEIAEVKNEVNKMEQESQKGKEQPEQKDIFNEKKKVDLTKVFGNNK